MCLERAPVIIISLTACSRDSGLAAIPGDAADQLLKEFSFQVRKPLPRRILGEVGSQSNTRTIVLVTD